ncbi:hypothetical protein FOL47_007216 [Perkinsus chesapeaki]|uniref:Uncharacterized protein n=1 Tax=Perkinsus chesapeaki TaxID=330153 RepID=A0A7J6LLX9_PERCH|nr:hypothetical protein FOL47_007216 [Perkinsus chesapeaki]
MPYPGKPTTKRARTSQCGWMPIHGIWKPLRAPSITPSSSHPLRADNCKDQTFKTGKGVPASTDQLALRRSGRSSHMSKSLVMQKAAAKATDEDLSQFVASAHSLSTVKQKSAAWNSFKKCISAAGRKPGGRGVDDFILWIHSMTKSEYKYSTIYNYVGHVRRRFEDVTGSPFQAAHNKILDLSLRAARKIVGDEGPLKAITLNKDEIISVAKLLSEECADIMLAGIIGMCRCSELFDLYAGDVMVTDFGIQLRIVKSKTDQYRTGHWVRIGCIGSRDQMGSGCGEAWCIAHRLLLRAYQLEAPDCKLFTVTRNQFAESLRDSVIQVTSCPAERATSHLMRRSGAVLYFRANTPLPTIAELGRWKDAACLEGYLRDAGDACSYLSSLTVKVWSAVAN